MRLKPVHIFSALSLAFLAFSFSIYLNPVGHNTGIGSFEVSQGRLAWQKHNCHTCHQLYGLGGYLGPDLTNVYGAPGKGEPLIRAMLKTGSAQMPAFELTETETDHLLAFLKETDAQGSADPRDFTIQRTGMTTRK